jgi:hypothetical protein
MAILKNDKGYNYDRPYYDVDPNALISAGMIAFLMQSGTTIYATTAANAVSGAVPIGTFWKDHNLGYYRSTVESKTFDAANQITLTNGSLISTAKVRVASTAGVVYTLGADYTVTLANGIVTRLGGGLIAAGQTVIVTYEYSVTAAEIVAYGGTNYDHVPDDTLGSGSISVIEGWAHIYTDQYDVEQTYTLNAPLRSNAESKWTSATTAYSVCGRVIEPPSVGKPYLGICQTTVLV